MVSKKSTTAEVWPGSTVVAGLSGAGQNEGMKKTLLFVLALAVIPVGVDAQGLEVDDPDTWVLMDADFVRRN